MVRATLVVKTPDDLKNAYTSINGHRNFNVVKITNNISATPQQSVTLNVIYADGIIGEILINIGKNQPLKAQNKYTYEFLIGLSKVDTHDALRHKVLWHLNALAE